MPRQLAVKANYLSRFAPFVQWPSGVLEAASPLSICIAGDDPFGSALEDLTRDQPVNGHPIQVRHVETIEPGMNCQILYTGDQKIDEALQKISHEPTLTVTDGVAGGIIQFATIRGRVRFTIDQTAAQESGLVISSKLLGLAAQIKR